MASIPQANGHDNLTLLRCAKHLTLAKTWLADGSISAYGNPKFFTPQTVRVDGVRALSAALKRLEGDPQACLIRGLYVGDEAARARDEAQFKTGQVRRALDYFADQPLHTCLVDVDGFEPLSCYPEEDPVGAIEECIQTQLPPEFHGISYHYQLSASAGHSKYRGLLKVHLWFWLSDPATSAQLRAWAGAHPVVDSALFNAVQVHYTARPLFSDGLQDPVPQRSGFVEGASGDSVDLELSAPPTGVKGDVPRLQRLQDLRAEDPVAQALNDRGMVKSLQRDGINVVCPFEHEHTSASSETSTTYWLPHTGGRARGSFVCLHAHCREREQEEFLSEIGLGVESEFQAITEAATEAEPASSRRVRYNLDQVPYDEFVVEGFLSTGTTTIAGGHGAGKSSNLVPLAAAIAHLIDSPLKPVLRRKVLWITEYPRQVMKTLYGLRKCAPGAASQGDFEEWFQVFTAERSNAAKLGAFITQLVAENIVEGPNGYEVLPLVVLDTANANIDIEHESDNSGIGKAIAAIRKAIRYDRGAAWIVTHTPGGQRTSGVDGLTARGGTAWEADVDAVAYLAVEGDNRRFMKLGKRRFEAAFDTIEFSSETGLELVDTPWLATQEVVYRYGSAAPSNMAVVQEARQEKKGVGTTETAARAVSEAVDEMSGAEDPVLNWRLVVDRARPKLPRGTSATDQRTQALKRGREWLVKEGLLAFDGDVGVKRIKTHVVENDDSQTHSQPLTSHSQ
jgi:hypothetical protein